MFFPSAASRSRRSSGSCPTVDTVSACAAKANLTLLTWPRVSAAEATHAPAAARSMAHSPRPCARFFPSFAADLPYNSDQLQICDFRLQIEELNRLRTAV